MYVEKTSFRVRVVNTPTGPKLRLTPDQAFLSDPNLVYPVIVDPTTDLSVTQDTYVELLYPNQSYGTDNELKVGAIDSGGQTQKARSFIKFGIGPVSGTDVISATLHLYENHSWSCTPKKVEIYRLNSSWSGPTWNTQPDYGLVYASKTFAHGYSASCPNAWVTMSGGGGDGRTLTDLVQGWANGNITNHGLAVRADVETDLTSWKKFNSSDHANNQPYLEVTYNSYPLVPTGLSAADEGYRSRLSATFRDPDPGNGRVDFRVKDASGTVIVDQLGSSVPAGQASSYLVPLDTLADGQTYSVRARGYDGTNYSAFTGWQSFTPNYLPLVPVDAGPLEGALYEGGDNTIVGTYADGSPGNGRIEYQIMDESCTTTLATDFGQYVSNGTLSPWTPSPAMSLGRTYGLRARAIDPTGQASAFSACGTFDALRELVPSSPGSLLTTSTTPTLSVEVGAGVSGTITPPFEVYSVPNRLLVASGEGTAAASGQASTWTVPAGALSVGERYFWQARDTYTMSTDVIDIFVVGSGPQVVLTHPVMSAESGLDLSLVAEVAGFESVSSVDFKVDGVTVASDSTAPYEANYVTSGDGANHQVSATATGTAPGGTPATANSDAASVLFANDIGYLDPRIQDDPAVDEPLTGTLPEVTDFSDPPLTTVEAAVAVSAAKIRDYALKHVFDYNGRYREFDWDCTNFVSQALLAGGWRMKGNIDGSDSDKASLNQWWYDHDWCPEHLCDDWTKTWSFSNSLSRSTGGHGLAIRGVYRTRLRDVQVGDIIFFDYTQAENRPGTDHSMVVTKVRKDLSPWNFYVTYHEPNSKNRPWFDRSYDNIESVAERMTGALAIEHTYLFHPFANYG